jgi:hypothetical protein
VKNRVVPIAQARTNARKARGAPAVTTTHCTQGEQLRDVKSQSHAADLCQRPELNDDYADSDRIS